MKSLRFLPLLLVAALMAGCQTINHQDRQVLMAHNVPQGVYEKMLYGDPLSLDDVITLSQHAVTPGLIIHYISETDTIYILRKADVKKLRTGGVNESVISYMLATAPQSGPYGPGPYPGAYAGPYGPYAGPYAYGYPGPYGYGYGPSGYYDGFYGAGPIVFVGGRFGGGRFGHGGFGRGGFGHGGFGHHH